MSTVLFLTYRMAKGYGVDVVIHNVSKHLRERGHRVVVGCIESDGFYFETETINILPQIEAVRLLAQSVKPDVIVAHTSPFFELLPELVSEYSCWAWEHGDPTPAFFPGHEQERQQVKDFKLTNVYPKLKGVIAISEFVRHDIGWPTAHIILNGCDHMPAAEPKPPRNEGAPFRVGTLMRLGLGESHYKGNSTFLKLCRRLQREGVECHLMGRGTKAQAEAFRQYGVHVHLNASEIEKSEYLRMLDIFISCSTWEGFNLPIAEAQALGTMSLAFDTGAHPEVTPFVMRNIDEATALINACKSSVDLLKNHSSFSTWSRKHFVWAETTSSFEAICLKISQVPIRTKFGSISFSTRLRLYWVGARAAIQSHGWKIFLLRSMKRTVRKTLSRLERLRG